MQGSPTREQALVILSAEAYWEDVTGGTLEGVSINGIESRSARVTAIELRC